MNKLLVLPDIHFLFNIYLYTENKKNVLYIKYEKK